jgi:tryptophan synthase beta chain
VLHGTRTWLLQDDDGQILPTHSVSAGLDYPAVGPEHAWLREQGRIEYTTVGDGEAVAAFHTLATREGILPALESAHAVAEALRRAPRLSRERLILVNLSGRGDKDLDSVAAFDAGRGVSEPVTGPARDWAIGEEGTRWAGTWRGPSPAAAGSAGRRSSPT